MLAECACGNIRTSRKAVKSRCFICLSWWTENINFNKEIRVHMASHCNTFSYFTCKPCTRKPMSLFSTTRFTSPQKTPFFINFSTLKLSTPRFAANNWLNYFRVLKPCCIYWIELLQVKQGCFCCSAWRNCSEVRWFCNWYV